MDLLPLVNVPVHRHYFKILLNVNAWHPASGCEGAVEFTEYSALLTDFLNQA